MNEFIANKKKVLFVGSFKETSKSGGVGGQMFACKTIINSELSSFINWTLIDTTADSNILASKIKRLRKAMLRLFKFIYYMIFFKHDYILIFVADGLSFWEKGLMGLIGKVFTRSKIIIAPRSGLITNDINNKGSLKTFIEYVFKKVDIVICQSKSWQVIFEKLAGENKSKFIIIENLIDYDKYKSIQVRDLRKNEKVVVLFMAWVTRNKGIFELVEAVKMLKNDNCNFKLIIAGLGEDYEVIVDEVEKQGLSDFVDFRGWVLGDKKLKILEESDIFVLPTYFDGYPNSLMEAMASGKACIGTKVGSIPDIINDCKNGILIEKQNVKELYHSLKYLIHNDEIRLKMGSIARDNIREINSIPVGILKYKKIFSIQ
ncbi:glycosyltransferase family 4 protein [Flavobacterium ardleyense]|uniref:Glycosyltransferase family 4 protein n=1 Tax=Flavobacterium ardleyense TaxID=2038737 RepID=A0ABW5Z335_9FLAO